MVSIQKGKHEFKIFIAHKNEVGIKNILAKYLAVNRLLN